MEERNISLSDMPRKWFPLFLTLLSATLLLTSYIWSQLTYNFFLPASNKDTFAKFSEETGKCWHTCSLTSSFCILLSQNSTEIMSMSPQSFTGSHQLFVAPFRARHTEQGLLGLAQHRAAMTPWFLTGSCLTSTWLIAWAEQIHLYPKTKHTWQEAKASCSRAFGSANKAKSRIASVVPLHQSQDP